MSLKTLLERFTRGLPLPSASGYGEMQYYGDDEDYMTDPRTLDLAEKEELIRNNQTKIYDLQERLKQIQADEKAKADAEAKKLMEQTVGKQSNVQSSTGT